MPSVRRGRQLQEHESRVYRTTYNPEKGRENKEAEQQIF